MHRPPHRSPLQPRVPQPIRPRSVTALLATLLVVVLGIWFLSRTTGISSDRPAAPAAPVLEPVPAPRDHATLERAVAAVEQAAAELTASELEPDIAARALAERLNAGRPELGFVVGSPTDAWQVALVPLPAHGAIRVEAYGAETALPALMTEIRLRPR